MLEQVCKTIHNFFIKDPNPGTYTIENGTISPLPSLLEGQRIWIVGSALNDGMYTYHAAGITNDDETASAELVDEVFSGSVCALAVPRDLISLSKDISDWVAANSEALNSPYTSESFGGYSYTKATASGADAGGALTWQNQFKSRLNPYRKISL